MYLKNAQFQEILRLYDEKQARQRHLLDLRRQEIFEALPAYARLEDEITGLWAQAARAAARGGDSSRFSDRIPSLMEQQRQLLTEAGYPADYLEMQYDCPICRDTGFTDGHKCSCFTAAATDLLYRQSSIRDVLQKENFSSFRLDYYSDQTDPRLGISPRDNMRAVLQVCRQFIDSFEEKGGNLLLYGDTGVGKTFLINCIAKELLDAGFSCIYFTAPQLVDIMERSAFGRREDEDDYEQDAGGYIFDCDLLIIDDLGSELNNAFVNAQLFQCINTRLTAGRSTLVSTNLRPEDLQSIYSERISSRLLSAYDVLWIFGEDIRMKLSLSP